MSASFRIVLVTVAALMLSATVAHGLARDRVPPLDAPESSRCHADDPPPPELMGPPGCGTNDRVGPSYPTLTDSIAASVGLTFLLFVIGGRRFFTLFSQWAPRASQLIAFCMLVSVVGSATVALVASSWSPSVSAAVPTRAEVTSVLLFVLVPVWLLLTGSILVVGRWLAARRQVPLAQPN